MFTRVAPILHVRSITLATLSTSQLINLIDTLVDSHPELADDIADLVPRPTIASVQPLFGSLETKLQESFPYTKWGPSRDDYSFNRVKPVLEELVVSVNKTGTLLRLRGYLIRVLDHNPIHQSTNQSIRERMGEDGRKKKKRALQDGLSSCSSF